METIRVRNLQTGQTGKIPKGNFNPQKYEVLEEGRELPGWAKTIAPILTELMGAQIGQMAGVPLGAMGGGAVGSVLPGAGTVVGAAGGAVAGGYGGRVAGGGAGRAAGEMGIDYLEDILNKRELSSDVDLGDSFKTGAVSEAIGTPLAKGAGLLAHPIKPLIGRVNKILENSPKTFNITDLISKGRAKIQPDLDRQMVGTKGREALNQTVVDMIGSARERITHTSGKIVDDLPISELNDMKRLLYKNAKEYGRDTGKLPQEVSKKMGRFLKETIEEAEPGVKLPNSIASLLYKVPDLMSTLPYLIPGLPLRGVGAINKVGSIPFKVAQKAIPEDGGLLQQIFPALFQLGREDKDRRRN